MAFSQGNLVALITSGGFGMILLLYGLVSFINKLIILSKSTIKYLKLLEDFNKINPGAVTEIEVKKVLNHFLKHQKELVSK